ncbi:unnamed protein product [Microthlaspi erraticum]|uniref:F-box domain-containing protein n=1 Tax=Microthlaspi erraticum TaxID=1685480 RepID=A0A6D2J4E2_9BRAS|nr:unnamed protein product [Microthlaspi erraticum]
METPKKKLMLTPPQSTPILSLPYDLLLNCIAHVSRLYYPTLSLVSKSFRSLVASPELYKVRSLLGRTESCLYVCLKRGSKYSWFTLCRKPDKSLTNEEEDTSENKSSGYVLATASIPHSTYARFGSIVAVGSNIYNIDTSTGSVSVSILDCRSHTWRTTSSIFRVKRKFLSASALDGKIYVAGVCKEDDGSYKNSVEVFDTRTQSCDPVPIPFGEEYTKVNNQTLCIDGKFHVVLFDRRLLRYRKVIQDRRVLAYDSKQGRWDEVLRPGMSHYMISDSYCEIDNVLYSAANGAIRWYDTEESMWREVMSLVGLPELPDGERIQRDVRLADYGGKMAVLWEKISRYDNSYATIVWCAEIALERYQPCQIRGRVEWFDRVLTSYHYDIVKVVAATL